MGGSTGGPPSQRPPAMAPIESRLEAQMEQAHQKTQASKISAAARAQAPAAHHQQQARLSVASLLLAAAGQQQTSTPSTSQQEAGARAQRPLAQAPLPLPLPPAATAGPFPSEHEHERGPSSQSGSPGAEPAQARWLAQVASQTQQGVRQRMSQASDQLGHSLRQLYASASSITSAAGAAVDVPPSYHNIPGIVPYYQGRSVGPPPSYDDVVNPFAAPPTYQSLFGQMCEARKTSRGLLDLMRRLVIILASTLGCTILIASMILIPFTMIIVGAIYIDECNIEHIPAFLLVGGLVWAAKNVLHCYWQCRKVERLERSEALAAEIYLASSGDGDGDDGGHGGDDDASNSNLSNSSRSPPTSSERLAGGAALASPGDEEVDELQLGQRIAASHQAHRHERPSGSRHQQPSRPEHRTGRFKSSVCESLLNCVLFGWFIAGCVIVLRNYEPDFEDTTSPRYCHRTVYMYTFWLISSALLSLGLFVGCICCLMVSSAVASRQHDIDLA